MKLTFREGGLEALPSVARLERVCFTDPWSEDVLRQAMTLPAAFCLTAWRSDGQDAPADNALGQPILAGYLFSYVIAPEGEIANLAVSPECRRQGIGEALLREGLERMKEKGCRRFFLEVRESNWAARALYGKLGFAIMGRRRSYYRNPVEDALLMALAPLEEEKG